MYTKHKYSFRDMLLWTRRELLVFVALAFVPTALFEVAGFRWLQLPWTPIALIGTAVAFLIGFQNNAAYGRAWEARKIWGGIINDSRSWAIMVQDMVTSEHVKEPLPDEQLEQHRTTLIHRHLAWITALRYAMRQSRPWETFAKHHTNREWHEKMHIPELDVPLEEELQPLLSPNELSQVLEHTNKPAALLSLQSSHLRQLTEAGCVWEFSFLEFENQLRRLFDLQGKSERIKNYPYPRQYASLCYDLVRVFIGLLPFAVIPVFAQMGGSLKDSFPEIGQHFVWMAVPFAVTISWVFHTMQRIGIVGENPFEGSANDVPISTIARGIEIDLRELNGEPRDASPAPLAAVNGVQM